jgi:Trk-type K+ transport system membrane component
LLLLPTIFVYSLIRFALQGKPITVGWVIGGLLITLVFGAIVFLLDLPGRRSQQESQEEADYVEDEHEGGRLIPRFLTFTSLLMFIIPIMGLVLSIAALIANWNRPGWSRTISRICLVLSSVATAGFAILMLAGK